MEHTSHNNLKIKTAILSVYDKTGIVEFAKALSNKGIQLYSTGGTYKEILGAGIPVNAIEDYLNFPEILSGRVKTLHPKIHGGILARRDNPSDQQSLTEHNIIPFDLVCINLYPFKKFIDTANKQDPNFLSQAIEMIDIGGPTMIRSAAKNYKYVCAVTNYKDYPSFLNELEQNNNSISIETRTKLSAQAFLTTSNYDTNVQQFLHNVIHTKKDEESSVFPQYETVSLKKRYDLRYGENPHQKAAFYLKNDLEDTDWKILHGKEMSYNNFLDLDAAIALSKEFSTTEHFCAIFKHTNPCGVTIHTNQKEALIKAMACDPVSYFGGIVIFNHTIELDTAEVLHSKFFEIIIAPNFSPNSLSILQQKKNIRIIQYNPNPSNHTTISIRNSSGGFLLQEVDIIGLLKNDFKIVTQKQPSANDSIELEFAWKIVKVLKSNAIAITKNNTILGLGAGQTSRVDSIKIAIQKAKEYGHNLEGSYLASDAFFPFRDSIDIATKEGITGFIQPGGSIKDEESITAANEAKAIMVFTGVRHFKH